MTLKIDEKMMNEIITKLVVFGGYAIIACTSLGFVFENFELTINHKIDHNHRIESSSYGGVKLHIDHEHNHKGKMWVYD